MNIENLKNAELVEIEEVEGVGVEIAKSIKNYFITEKNLMIIQNMFNNGVLIKSENKNSLKLAGKTFCITGTFNNFSRDYLKDKINKESGKVTSSVSKRTDFLIAGDNPGNKLNDAKSLKIKIINEQEFLELLK